MNRTVATLWTGTIASLWTRSVATLLTLLCLATSTADAKVVRIEVLYRMDLAGGLWYGLAGAYEKIVGTIYFAIDPDNPANGIITDIAFASSRKTSNQALATRPERNASTNAFSSTSSARAELRSIAPSFIVPNSSAPRRAP